MDNFKLLYHVYGMPFKYMRINLTDLTPSANQSLDKV